jgi:RNA polymerase primary sigma factor
MSIPTDTRKHDTVAENDALSLYLKEISRIPLLTRDEEQELARNAKCGDGEAKRRMALSNLRFVVTMARKYRNQGVSFMDLISEGNIGLMRAVDKFDVDKGYHFITYAVWWIRQSMLHAIAVKSGLIRLPVNQSYKMVQLKKMINECAGKQNEKMDIDTVADKLNIDHTMARDLLQHQTDYIPFDACIFDDKDGPRVVDMVKDEQSNAPDEIAINKALQQEVREALSTLTERESEIIRYRFGIDGEIPLTLEEIGKRLNLSKERIRQIENRILKKLRHCSQIKNLKKLIVR